MSQNFHLCLATDTLAADAQTLGVTIEDLQSIQVEVIAKIVKITQTTQQLEWHLQLDYRITLPLKSLAAQLDWPTWQPVRVGFADYLWEQTCLECFLAGGLVTSSLINNSISMNDDNENGIDAADINKTSAYIEINASPDGRYAVYQFSNYRNPAALPPTPLLQPDGQIRALINWSASHCHVSNFATDTEQHSSSEQIEPSIDSLTFNTITPKSYYYERSFNVPLSQLSNVELDINDTVLKYIHPCVILSFGTLFNKTTLYFAPKHASPPDFHDLHYWSLFDKQAARAK